MFVQEVSKSSLCAEVKKKQAKDPKQKQIKKDVVQQKVMAYKIRGDGIMRYQGKSFLPNMDGLLERILDETHTSRYVVNPRFTKMYHDLKEIYRGNSIN
ncbi:MAG: hypothetical protein Q8851_01535 [Sweet potato little leaf phytoplasma]|nr:hypothetical protein [Sweet potato little leaf phytoplasma]